jgi:hypothetical protein
MRPADTKRALDFSDKPRQSAKSPTFCKALAEPDSHTAESMDSLQQCGASFAQTVAFPSGYLYRALLLDADANHAERLITRVLQPQRLVVDHVHHPEEALVRLQQRNHEYVLVIINISAMGSPWHRVLQELQHACRKVSCRTPPLFLCVSKTEKETEFILKIEHMGARYVYER